MLVRSVELGIWSCYLGRLARNRVAARLFMTHDILYAYLLSWLAFCSQRMDAGWLKTLARKTDDGSRDDMRFGLNGASIP